MAYVITGPTSGIGYRTALEVAEHHTVILVGRDAGRLAAVQQTIETRGGHAVPVVCDLSEPDDLGGGPPYARGLGLPLDGLLNNAGVMQTQPRQNSLGWDVTFATNHLGPFALTEALAPHLPDGATVVFICSGVEDPARRPAVVAGFRGGRYLSAADSARGEWAPGGSKLPGGDAYATSKQANLATVFEFARETPRLRFAGVEPGFNPATDLSRDSNAFLQALGKYVLSPLAPYIKYWSNPKTAGRVITKILTGPSTTTGAYYDENGKPMKGSEQVHDPAFDARVVTETRALLADVDVEPLS